MFPPLNYALVVWHWDYTFEAGTDCVGFAQRSSSYSGRKYEWYELPLGSMEIASTDYAIVQNGYVWPKVRNYPSDLGESETPEKGWPHVAHNIIHTRTDAYDISNFLKTKGNLTEGERTALMERLLKIVPGDIWVKDSTEDGTDRLARDHIAIIAYLPPNAHELSVTDLMNQIILIEGEYSNKIQSVIKKLSVGDYNRNDIDKKIQIYPSFSLNPGELVTGLNCQSWAIRRLK